MNEGYGEEGGGTIQALQITDSMLPRVQLPGCRLFACS